MKKRILSVIFAIAFILSFASCNRGTVDEKETTQPATAQAKGATVNLYTIKGPTGMGMAQLMKKNDEGGTKNKYNVNVVTTPEEIVAAISNGSADMAACPLNLASTLYKKTNGEVKMASVNTLGVMYLLENGDTVKSVADLKGKTIYLFGQGATPEYILNYVLEKNGLDPQKDVTIEYKSEHAEVSALAASGDAKIVLLPEPNVTSTMAQNSELRVALDFNEEWDKISNQHLAQSGVIVTAKFLNENPEAVKIFLDEYKESVEYVNHNIDDAAQLIEDYGIVPKAAIAKKALPNCNIIFITGDDMESIVKTNLEVLYNANPKSVGGVLPDENFYYKGYEK